MKIVIFTADSNGGYPVPAVKGGAVSTLIESLVNGNSKQKQCDMTVVSFYDQIAADIAKTKYPDVHFVWVKTPGIFRMLDGITFWGVKIFLKKKKAISFKSVFSLLWYIHFSSKYLEENIFDDVVLENNIPIAAIIKRSGYQKPYYYHFHNTPRINANCKDVFNNCSGFLCVSDYVGKEIEKANNPIGPVSESKVRTLYNCIDTDLFKPMEETKRLLARKQICEKYSIPESQKLVIFAGRLSKEKGVDQLLQAVKNMPNITVLIVGGLLSGLNLTDSYQEKIRKLAAELGERVIFTEYVEQQIMPKYYNAADLAVLPSMWDEPAGLTMIEAMACGTPVITTRSGGIPEYVGDVAYVLDRDENLPQNIAKSINDYLELSSEKQEKIRNAGIQRIREKFSADHYLERFIECIDE